MKMKTPAPNFTQTPNDLFDHWLPHLGEVELKVLLVIMRKTFGWHRKREMISISMFQKLIGSNRNNIVNAVNNLIEKGIISKSIEGSLGTEETYYELVIDEGGGSTNSVPPPSTNAIPPLVPNQYPSSLEHIHIAKERIKEIDDDDARTREEKLTLSDVHHNCIKHKKDWLSDEIDKAYEAYDKYSGDVTSPLEYIEAIIKKNRIIKQNKAEKCQKKSPSKISLEPEISKKSSTIDNAVSSVIDTSEHLLANFMREQRRKLGLPTFS